MTFRVFPTRPQSEDEFRPTGFGRREQQEAERLRVRARRLKTAKLSALAAGSGLLALYAVGLI